MLFNSYEFIFYFLPITWLVFVALTKAGWARATIAWLTLASFFFYGYWSPRFLWLLLASILFNFACGRGLAAMPDSEQRRRWWLTAFAVTANLLLLGYFKYMNFFLANLSEALSLPMDLPNMVLPIGISFYTFQQISFLVDSYRREVHTHSLWGYALFVTFFPHLIAGPLVHPGQMLPQFANGRRMPELGEIAMGITAFAIGLFKKVVIADSLALGASPIFNGAAAGTTPDFATAWAGALCYGMQIYFDFSAYSDMAIGLALLFGIRLPQNFASPYQSASIIEFWRRWHISLSRFLRHYLYEPLGGRGHDPKRRYVNIFATMLLGGIWHGAGWTFVLWGALHGLLICANHLWRAVKPAGFDLPRWLGIVITFTVVILAWVPFRAADLETTWRIYSAMLGLGGSGASAAEFGADAWAISVMLPIAAAIALFLPNLVQWFGPYNPALLTPGYGDAGRARAVPFTWQPAARWAMVAGLMLAFTLTKLNDVSEFIYFQF